ncbi:hypothetical protein Pmani_029020 [Petrolisthes manimaculis]|uniref:Cytochrome oxidase complex assembly protein 1 n=1 Tax=Petrolisthes manimaculis TaxID=1843537 RepID=A0AAE1TUW3_9EUCA|nr:hypothetical protein Pmani_029020 [Petrolisthes manimaculis]
MSKLGHLSRIAAVVGLAVLGSSFYFKSRIVSGIKQTPYYQESLKELRSHRGIVHLLGEPIIDGSINIGDNTINFSTDTYAQFQVPVAGTKQSGTLYLWASRTLEEGWRVDRLELGLKDDPGRRVLLKATPMSEAGVQVAKEV